MPNQIDNDIYNRIPEEWWSKKGFLNILQSATNPWRVPYFRRVLTEIKIDPQQKKALEVGCGGGLLTEEIAKMGFTTTGLDVSLPSLEVARRHAKENGLEIDYQHGFGDKLPFADASFDAVFCCDTLEHITNWDETVREISRVLKPRGVFFYNTVNRTSESMKNTIKMMQEWWPTRFAPPNTHVWEMFITPEELRSSIESNGLIQRGLRGTKFIGTAFQVFSAILLYKFGIITSAGFGRRIQTAEGDDISVNYMGYAVKPQ